MAQHPLMPKAVAVWLIENTALTFDQIGAFCGLHGLEIQAIANGDVSRNIVGNDPIMSGELTWEEIHRCEADKGLRLEIVKSNLPQPQKRSKGPKYTPIAKRGDKPDAIAYLAKNHGELSDAQICKLIGTTKPTVKAIRDRTHINTQNIKPRHPVELGLCTREDLESAVQKAQKKAGIKPQAAAPTDADTAHDDAGNGTNG